MYAIFESAGLIAIFAGALRYDVRETARLRKLKLHPFSRANKRRPHITVVISTLNNAATIESCLGSIFIHNYRNVDVLITDRGSRDHTVNLIRNYIKQQKNRRIRFIANRSKAGNSHSLYHSIIKYGKGELLLTLPANYVLGDSALLRLAQRFAGDENLAACNLDVHIIHGYNIANIFAQYRSFIARRIEKFQGASNRIYSPGAAACYRTDVLNKMVSKHESSRVQIGFAQDAAIYRLNESKHQTSGKIARDDWIGSFVQRPPNINTKLFDAVKALGKNFQLAARPLILTYLLYLALKLHEPKLLLTALGILSSILLLSIWDSPERGAAKKTALALGIPLTFSLFYFESLLKLLAGIFMGPVRAIIYKRNRYQDV
jgi:glycosyltransferase involved in cell wall biosynthesis